MIEIWDYFMRRKGLLLATLAVFLISSLLSYRAMYQAPTSSPSPDYISIANWTEPESPLADADDGNYIVIISPEEVIELGYPTVSSPVEFEPMLSEENNLLDFPSDDISNNSESIVSDVTATELEPVLLDITTADSESVILDPVATSSESIAEEDALDFAVPEIPKTSQPDNISIELSTVNKVKISNIIYNLFLSIASLIILTLGGYLTYQHFMR